ncbi:MipA/OmpV family protein [Psychrosphaera aquimarina]|uniref:MipA/OmpV family protein n=1 Tax=Psychrosphaera aquimarina TaxID=2044854 RepID=A0ABU3QXU6_9GAMM|nr:MipA/OmpV family protein [Psychrosphaera aquimarina]MDU0111878.1 MipA/OmpV family protein [Psychrosphaera aquimarina]
MFLNTMDLSAGEAKYSLALGKGSYSSILRQNDETNFYLLPRWSYYNKQFYIENLDLGFNLVEYEAVSIDLSTKQSFDALLFKQHSLNDSFMLGLSAGLPVNIPWGAEINDYFKPKERRLSYLAGFSVFVRLGNWQLVQEIHQDVTNVHDGFQITNQVRYASQLQDFSYSINGSTRWLSESYANYYYGVNNLETSNTYEYLPGQSLLTSLKIELSYRINESLRLVSSFKREWFPSDFIQSLQIGQTQQDITFTGILYSW